jgi:hypothetical protein
LSAQHNQAPLLRLLGAIRDGISALVSTISNVAAISVNRRSYGAHCRYRRRRDMLVLCSFNRRGMHEVLVGAEEIILMCDDGW